jgi:hypothetical protein
MSVDLGALSRIGHESGRFLLDDCGPFDARARA